MAARTLFILAWAAAVILATTNCAPHLASHSSDRASTIPFDLKCSEVNELMTAAPSSTIAWHANKGTVTAPNIVDGEIGFLAAYFQNTPGGDFNLKLSLDLSSLNSGVGLRDQRIRDIVFGAVQGQKFEFEAMVSTADALAVQNLSLNQSLNLTLWGNLSLWGAFIPLSVPVTVSLQTNGLHIASTPNFSLGIMTQLGLSANIIKLTSICGSTPLDTVPIDFDFTMTKPCG